MNMDTFIFVGFCIFMLLVGMRLKQRFGEKRKKEEARINKNQRPKMANTDEPEAVREHRERRERRTRLFTIIQMIVLFGLMVFMIPALVRDLMAFSTIDKMNLFLRCFIFIFTIYIFILSYLKVFQKKKEEE